jgi:hypothetical protein
MQKRLIVLAIASALPASLVTSSVWAADAAATGVFSGNLQYRYEKVTNAAAAANEATANTLRARMGYTTATYSGFGMMVEGEAVANLGNDTYDSKASGQTANGRAVIADPEAAEVNQAFLSYSGLADTNVKWGRQRLILDNARFVGNVGWRQNEQTFDALTIVNTSLPGTKITLGRINNVNRIFSDSSAAKTGPFAGNHKMHSNILNASYKGLGFAEVVGYVYQLKYDVASGATANSADTMGLRLNGSSAMGENKLLYTVEFATQKDGGNNPKKYSASYTLLEGGIDITSAVFKVGYEVLGSDASATVKATGAATTQSFSTPLATLHAFNGWADMYLTTPTQGLKDMYVSAGTKLAGVSLGLVLHDYKAAQTTAALTSSSLGSETNLVATKAIDKNLTLGLKYADYKAKGTVATTFTGNVNTKKTWLWGEFKF